MNEFLKALGPVKQRIRRNRMLRGAAFGLAAGAAGAAALLAVSRLVMIPDAKLWAGAVLIAAVLLCAAGNALRKVTDREAAVRADRCGLQERAVTALDAAPVDTADEMARVMRETQARDAMEALDSLDPKAIRPGSVRRLLLAAGIGCALCAVMLSVPNAMDRKTEEFKALQVRLNRLSAEAEEAEKREEAGKTEAEKQELRRLTEDLKRDLAQSRDEADAMVAVDRAEKRLEQMRHSTAGEAREAMEAARALAEALSGAGLDDLARALEAGDEQAMAQALAGMDAAAAEALSQAAEGLDGEMKEAAEAMESAVRTGDAGQAASDAMEALQSDQSGGAVSASALQQALQNMKAALSGNGETAGSRSGGSSSQQSGPGNSGGRNGSGAGLGEGNGGQQQESSPGGSTSGQGRADPKYREREYESVYDPEKAEAGYRDEMTDQKRLGEDSVRIQAGEGKGTAEGSVPYGQVIGEYARTETRSADSENLTAEQLEWVREYFRLLTDE